MDYPSDMEEYKGMGYLQKLTERQKRMEEKYFKKDKQIEKPVTATDKRQMVNKMIMLDKEKQKPLKKLVNTSNGFYQKSPFQFA